MADSVDPNDEPLPEPPEPAPGAPLLTDNDTRFLSHFFDEMNASPYGMPSFGEGLNFTDTWIDLPPQFMGSATSFGQQAPVPMPSAPPLGANLNDFHRPVAMGTNLMPPPPPPPPLSHQPSLDPREPTDDVINAAATLLQNGAAHRRDSKPTNDANYPPRRPVGPPVGHLRHQPLEEFKEEGRRGIPPTQHDNMFAEWMFGAQQRRPSRSVPTTDVQYGSDSNFSQLQGYTFTPDKETAENMSKEQLKYLDCLEPSKSADNTRPGSPNHAQTARSQHFAEPLKRPEDVETPPRKRRKSKNSKEVNDDDGEAESSSGVKAPRRRKPKSERGASISANPVDNTPGGKRRKSSANGIKAPRENLSEEQKRENHIRSEQKRRTLIKEGFDDLCDLVPGLRGGGFSKSTMLTMAADWLEELVRGNEALAAQLANVEGR